MPDLSFWFDKPVHLEWDCDLHSPIGDESGVEFYSYPLSWLVPYANVTRDEIDSAPRPLWVTEIHPESDIGKVDATRPGTFIIKLASSFSDYLEGLNYDNRKKFRWTLKRNSDLIIERGTQKDIDELWESYCNRISELNVKIGGKPYTQSDLRIRRELFSGPHISLDSFKEGDSLLGVNVSLWKNGVVYDLACLMSDREEGRKRSIGTLAVLTNLERAIENGMEVYDLLSGDYGVKHRFGAVEMPLKTFIASTRTFADYYKIPHDLVSEWI